ncbi:gastrula zinc finger protein XlCGF57.1-like isoform X27 [Euwallacea similis]|uniref:gastrula zinc finger protein XlCGF57.1-like isoform X27 n=1 Tax=Euwallacea similis TaxID=1736056 RepID=UPI00344BA772
MDNPGEILRLCRLCLVKDQVNIPIFEEQGDIRQTFLKIRSCLPVKVSRDDKLPKKICGGCSNKLDLFYEFWSSTANSEKTLQSWLGQEEEDDKMQEITKPVEALVKEESEALEDGHAHDQSFDEATKDEAEAPPAKRARRTAAVKAQINISHDSDEDEDVDGAEPITKIEDESDDSDGEEKDPSYTEVPGTSADDQAGPSGLGKDGVEAPVHAFSLKSEFDFEPVNIHIVPERKPYIKVGPRRTKKKSKQAVLDSQSLQCSICTKQFVSKKLFATHRYFHRIESSDNLSKVDFEKEDFVCTFCEVSFTSMDKLGSHLSTHEETCKQCGEVYPNAFVLGIHLAEHDAGEQVCCPFCEFKGAHPYSYKNHLFTKHFKLKILRCDSCGASYSSKAHLEEHVRFVHKKMDPHECIVCQRTFIFQSSLYKHQVNSHRPFIDGDVPSNFCIKCKRTFITVESFQKHLVLIHSEEKPSKPQEKYICDICGKDYSYRQSWLLHTKGHSGQLPYQCKSCPKSFRVKAFLTQHEKTHSDERPFNCEMCGNCFKRKEGLRRHLQTHTDVKPFGCSNCGKRFRRREHRRLHMNSCNKSCGVFTGS